MPPWSNGEGTGLRNRGSGFDSWRGCCDCGVAGLHARLWLWRSSVRFRAVTPPVLLMLAEHRPCKTGNAGSIPVTGPGPHGIFADVARLAGRLPSKQEEAGSSPVVRSTPPAADLPPALRRLAAWFESRWGHHNPTKTAEGGEHDHQHSRLPGRPPRRPGAAVSARRAGSPACRAAPPRGVRRPAAGLPARLHGFRAPAPGPGRAVGSAGSCPPGSASLGSFHWVRTLGQTQAHRQGGHPQ